MHSEQLVTGVAKLLSDTAHKHSDVQLKVGENTFHCHKLVLALNSPYFDELFQSTSSSAAEEEEYYEDEMWEWEEEEMEEVDKEADDDDNGDDDEEEVDG